MRPVGLSQVKAVAPVTRGEPTSTRVSVWVDADLAVGRNRPILGVPIPGLAADPDDGFALLAALREPNLQVTGVSTVGGNTRVAKAQAGMEEALRRFGAGELTSHAGGDRDLNAARKSAAVKALAAALEKGPLTVLALGPLTNLAALVTERPDLASRLSNVIAIAGHGENEPLKLGRVEATDFNVAQDPNALRVLQQAGVKLTVLPFSLTSQVFMDGSDLDALAASGNEAAGWLADNSRSWLANWKLLFGEKRGFNPFDTLAVAAAAHPEWFSHTTVPAAVSDEKGLVLGKGSASVTALTGFAPGFDAAQFKAWLLDRLTQPPAPPEVLVTAKDGWHASASVPTVAMTAGPQASGHAQLASLAASKKLGFETD